MHILGHTFESGSNVITNNIITTYEKEDNEEDMMDSTMEDEDERLNNNFNDNSTRGKATKLGIYNYRISRNDPILQDFYNTYKNIVRCGSETSLKLTIIRLRIMLRYLQYTQINENSKILEITNIKKKIYQYLLKYYIKQGMGVRG